MGSSSGSGGRTRRCYDPTRRRHVWFRVSRDLRAGSAT
jgi:hypothetical protein